MPTQIPLRTEPRTTGPRVGTIVMERDEQVTSIKGLEPWKVILFNDSHNTMDHVVAALCRIFRFSTQAAILKMAEAHTTGRTIVAACPLEEAEYYVVQLSNAGLTAEIQKD